MNDYLKLQVEGIRAKKVALIQEYDKSESVNSFIVNNDRMWLDKSTRVGLVNSTQIAMASGAKEIVLWYNDKNYTIPCETMLKMLSVLELYAMECYNVTSQHMVNVKKENDLNRLYNYNYTKGYPRRLIFNV